jgi:hypothetical protein
MHCRNLIGAIVVAALAIPAGGAQAAEGQYPDWRGAWARFVVRGLGGQPSFDQTKPWGFGQQAPLNAEYKKVLEDSLADQAKGGQGNFAGHAQCLPAGMPLMMIAFRPLEFVVTPDTTYVLVGGSDHYRRIFTDGRDWPKEIEPTYSGYSIGRWIDEDGDGRYDTLEIETRYFRGPRAFESTGLPLDRDNKSVIKERIYKDKADPNALYDEITVFDHALTQPWTLKKKAVRDPNPRPVWDADVCSESNSLVRIGKEAYFLSADGYLMPMKKNQSPPDLRYFKPSEP